MYPGRLDAAAARPQQSAFLVDSFPTLASKAAALTHGIIKGHPFINGNKRTGMLAGIIFMDLNGRESIIENRELVRVADAVVVNEMSLEDLTEWFDDWRRFLPLSQDEWETLAEEE